jgi:hypothetical protein
LVEALFYKLEGLGFDPDEAIVCVSIYPILPAALDPGFAQPLTQMSKAKYFSVSGIHFSQRITTSKKMFLENRMRPVRKADSLTAICEPTV